MTNLPPDPGPVSGSDEDLERRLRSRSRRHQVVVAVLLLGVLSCSVWIGMSMWKYRLEEAGPLEEVLTTTFVEFQLEWYRSLAYPEENRGEGTWNVEDPLSEARARAMDVLVGLRGVDAHLVGPFRALMDVLLQTASPESAPTDAAAHIREKLGPVNELLSRHEPWFRLDLEPFDGLLGNRYVSSWMLLVYEVLGTLTFSTVTDKVSLLVVRRRDNLDQDTSRHGYVRRDDTLSAFVLQDNATAFVADALMPCVSNPDHLFDSRLSDLPASLKGPYRRLVEASIREIRDWTGVSGEGLGKVAAMVTQRTSIYGRVTRRAASLGVNLVQPDGLLWPRSFAWQLQLENTAMQRKGEKLAPDEGLEQLLSLTESLEESECRTVLEAMAWMIIRSVGTHEARHVLDIRNGVPVSDCVATLVGEADDPDFVVQVDRETRAFLTQLIEAPDTSRLVLLELATYLLVSNLTVYGNTAEIILLHLVWDGRIPDALEAEEAGQQLLETLATLPEATVSSRARSFYETCLGPYEGLSLL